MKIRTLLVATLVMLGGVSASFADNVVTMNKLTRKFTVTTNVYDAGTVAGKTYTDLAVISVPANATIDASEKTTGYTISSTTFKGLPWNCAFQQVQPSLWAATPPNTDASLRFFIDLNTPIGKAMYANLLMAMETRGLVTISIDHASWINGVGYRVVQLIVEQ